MRSLLLVACFLSQSVFLSASTLSDLTADVKSNTHFTLFESITPSYFYDFTNGTQKASKAGVTTSVFTYRFLSGDVGWTGTFDTHQIGTAVGGGTIHVDKLLHQLFPVSSELVKEILIPGSARQFWDKVNFGVYGGHNFETKSFEYGVYSGLKLEF